MKRLIRGFCALALACATVTAAAAPVKLVGEEVVAVEHRGSKLVRAPRDVTRVSVGSSEILDVQTFPSSPQLLVTGKKQGSSSLTVWYGEESLTVNVMVTPALSAITAALKAALPNAKNLKVDSAGPSIVLSGEVTSAYDADRAKEIAKGFLVNPSGGPLIGDVVNLIHVQGDMQVQLEVSFAEVSRSGLRNAGVNLWGNAPNRFNGGMLAPTTPTTNPPAVTIANDGFNTFQGATNVNAPGQFIAPLSSAFNILFNLGSLTQVPLSAAISVLSSNGFARTLAEPSLVAISGHQANFMAGGEFPVIVPSTLGQFSVEWKKFGVQLSFTPTVLEQSIQLKLNTTVSEIDRSLGVKLQGFEVPGLATRYSETVVRLDDGQSFVIAGLLNDSVRSEIDRVPGLGDLPILGTLFRSTSYRRQESELLVVVTARLVRPQSERAVLPGEFTRADPTDLELFLFGSYESKDGAPDAAIRPKREEAAPRASGKEPVGPVGFSRESR